MNAAPFLRCLLFASICGLSRAGTPEETIGRALTDAGVHFDSGKYDSALVEYERVLQLDPTNRTATERIGRIWLARGAPVRARPFLTRAHAMSPDNLDLRRDLLRVSAAVGKWMDTRDGAWEILARLPNDRHALLFLATASRTPEQIRVLEKALRSADRTMAAYHGATAVLMQRRENLVGAHESLRRALAAEPEWPELHALEAAMLASRNELAAAAEAWRRASDLAGPRSDERIRYAEFLVQAGAKPAAVACLNETTRQAPDFVPAWRTLAEIALAERRFDEANACLRRAFDYDPDNYECEITRARLLAAQGDFARALEVLMALSRRYPDVSADKYQRALTHLQLKDGASALQALVEAVVQNPENDDAVLLLARLELMKGNPEAAATALIQLLAARPSLAPAQILLLEALGTLGRIDGAVARLRDRVKAVPNAAEPQRLLGLLLKYQGNYAEAHPVLQRALELAPGFFSVQAELVDLEVKQRHFDQATRSIVRLGAENPGSPAVCLLAARVYSSQGRWSEAEANLIDALQLDPSYSAAYDLLQRTLTELDDPRVAQQRIARFVAKRPDDVAALLVAGELYLRTGADSKARDAYERCVALRPHATVALNNLAYLYGERLRQPERALELASEAHRLDPRSPAIADTLGMILYRRGDLAAALPLLVESATKQPSSPEAQYHLGLCSLASGKKDVARAAFHRATLLPRDFPAKRDAEKHLAELGGPLDTMANAGSAK